MTLNLERLKILVLFLQLSAVAHFSRVNCAEMAGDKSEQPA